MDTLATTGLARGSSALHGDTGAALRDAFDSQLTGCSRLDVALSRVRLSTLGSLPRKLDQCEAVRVVLGAVRAHDLDAEAHALSAQPGGRERVEALGRLLTAGKVHVRASPLAGWSPDFSVFRKHASISPLGLEAPGVPSGSRRTLVLRPAEVVGLVGSHAFGGDVAGFGPLFSVQVEGLAAERLLQAFESIWARSHDVTPALSSLFRRALRWSAVPRLEASKSVDTRNRLG